VVNRVAEGIEESGPPVADRFVTFGPIRGILNGAPDDFETPTAASDDGGVSRYPAYFLLRPIF